MGITFKKDIPYLEEINLKELINKVPTPFYIYSQKTINDTYLKLSSILNKNIYYSIKANSNQAIIKLLDFLGAGIDVVSKEELQRALSAKVNPSKIIFEGVGKSKEDLEFAIKNKIKQINIESIQELKIINNICKNLNTITSIGIRINPGINAETLDKISTGRKTDKFGIDINDLSNVIQILKNSKNIKLIGISCHVGSQIFKLDTYKLVFEKMIETINFFKDNNYEISNLNLGGGFGVSYNNEKKFDLNKLSDLLKNYFNNSKLEISFEPGRYLVANSGFLITKIITTKINSKINFLITDAGMQTFLRAAMYDAHHNIIALDNRGLKKDYAVAGPICESSDIFTKNISLPEQKIDNYLAICDVGAYGSVMASNYNSKCLPAEILINKNKYKIIREYQNLNSLIENDIIPDWIVSS